MMRRNAIHWGLAIGWVDRHGGTGHDGTDALVCPTNYNRVFIVVAVCEPPL